MEVSKQKDLERVQIQACEVCASSGLRAGLLYISSNFRSGERDNFTPLHLLLERFERRKSHLGFLGIRAMDRFAAVAQGHLRKPFGIASTLGPFCPGVAIGMQRDAGDPDTTTGALKQGSPVFLVHGSEAGEQEA